MAARFCSHCGQELASTAQFCPRCGKPVGAGAEVTKVDAAAGATRRLLLPLVLTALLVLGIAVAVLAGRLRQQSLLAARTLPVAAAPSVLSAPTAPPPAAPAITNAPSRPVAAPAVTNAATKPAPQMPPEDARYLKFLQGIEQRRVALDSDASGATQMLQAAHTMQQGAQDDSDERQPTVQASQGKISQGYSDYVAKWNALTGDFRAVPPPPDCALLANAYLQFLTDYVATISKLQVALLNGDIGAAMGAQGAQKQVNADALAADGQLTDLCARFGVPKPFSIQVEGASSPLTGL